MSREIFEKGDEVICWLEGASYGDKFTVLEDSQVWLTLWDHKTKELCIVNNKQDYKLICSECQDGSGWCGEVCPYYDGIITYNCSKCNPNAI